MFTWLNKQGVKSDRGFIVQSVSRFIIEYRENNKIIAASVEQALIGNQAAIYIDPNEFNKWDDGSGISTEKKEEILKNSIEAMKFQGVKVLFG